MIVRKSDNLSPEPRRTKGISKLGQRRQIVIPKQICEQVRLEEGDLVEIEVTPQGIILKPKKLVDADDVLTPEEERRVRLGENELKRGKATKWTRTHRRKAE